MPGIIDKVLNKIEGNSSTTSNTTSTTGSTGSVGRTTGTTGSVSSKADYDANTGSAYDGTQSGKPAGAQAVREGERARPGDDLALREGTGPGTTGRAGAGATNPDGSAAGRTDRSTTGSHTGGAGRAAAGAAAGAAAVEGAERHHHHHTGAGNDVGMTDASGDRGINGTGTHGHHFRGLNDEHTFGHQPRENEAVPERLDANQGNVHHDAIHLGHKTHEKVLHPEIEEVERQREQERHVHHVQHHVQPVLERGAVEEQHQQRNVPVTRIHEKHVNEDEGDRNAYIQLGAKHEDRVEHLPGERQVIDKGERVHETVHHHVHNVIQPIVEKETVAPTRIHTTVPMHHVVHEAPIVHSSISHEPMAKEEFVKQGGQLGANLTHEATADRLLGGECERTVDGNGEGLLQELGIGKGNHTGTGTHTGMTGNNTTGTTGTRGVGTGPNNTGATGANTTGSTRAV